MLGDKEVGNILKKWAEFGLASSCLPWIVYIFWAFAKTYGCIPSLDKKSILLFFKHVKYISVNKQYKKKKE